MFKNYGLSLRDGINFLLKQATEKKSPILDLNIEQINPSDPDYKLVKEARKNRANGEKIHSLDEVMKEFKRLNEDPKVVETIMKSFGVRSLNNLKKEQYREFIVKLRSYKSNG